MRQIVHRKPEFRASNSQTHIASPNRFVTVLPKAAEREGYTPDWNEAKH